MAYIYLEELEKILPGILSDWIDGDDEGWKWIFQEIEQKCHVGKKEKKKKKWIFENLLAEFDVYKKSTDKLQHENVQHGLSIKDIQAEIRRLRDDIKAAKSMAETAKQRTEVDYSKYSGKSDGTVSYDSTSEDINQWRNEHESDRSRFNNKCASCKHIRTEPYDQPCIGCCYNGMNISGMDKWEAKDE